MTIFLSLYTAYETCGRGDSNTNLDHLQHFAAFEFEFSEIWFIFSKLRRNFE